MRKYLFYILKFLFFVIFYLGTFAVIELTSGMLGCDILSEAWIRFIVIAIICIAFFNHKTDGIVNKIVNKITNQILK